MTRRNFILLSILGLIAIFFALIGIPTFNNTIEKILKKDLNFLKIQDGAISKFVKEADESGHWNTLYFDRNKKIIVVLYTIFLNPIIKLPSQYKYTQLREKIVGEFLLSTDFFMNKMDESREIQYFSIYDPYKRPCSNPFSSLYYAA